MSKANHTICFIGFGEAGNAIATSLKSSGLTDADLHAFDLKLDDPTKAEDMRRRMDAAGVTAKSDLQAALEGAALVISVVTADQANAAATAAAPHIGPDTLYFDMNSCAPGTKQASASLIDGAGACYVDVAVMAPITSRGHQTQMLVASPHIDAAKALFDLLQMNVEIVGDKVGEASTIKMLRSVMIKGIEALTAECFQAACRAGVAEAVAKSLDASETNESWLTRASFNMERMTTHGIRRAAEMREVVKTLEDLGISALMTKGTVARQDAFGNLGLDLTQLDDLHDRMAEIEAKSKSG